MGGQPRARRLSVGSEYLAAQQDQGTAPIIIAVLRLEGVPDFDSLTNQFSKLLDVCPRFGYLLVKRGCNGSYFAWQDGPGSQKILKNCIKYKKLSGQNVDDEFEKFLNDRISDTNFDLDFPLWEVSAVTYEQDAKRSDVVFRVSHAVADGISLLSLLQYIAQPKKESPKDPLLDVKDDSSIIKSNSQVDLEFQPSNSMLNPSSSSSSSQLSNAKTCKFLLLPFVWFFHILYTIWIYIASIFKVLAIPNLPGDRQTSLKINSVKDLNSQKKTCRVYFSMVEIKMVSKKMGVTINDIVVSIISGGIRRYLVANGEKVPSQIRGTAIVNLRMLKDVNEGKEPLSRFGNHLAYIFVPFLLRDFGAKDRLMRVHKNLVWLKRSRGKGSKKKRGRGGSVKNHHRFCTFRDCCYAHQS
eukprot:TRINITY_DN14749_c1_g2_i1.p1 TRINITY_DN14749_c1_g2~~TRINITY_DN14749_c1_g2_i1.p1  ORF type:complete len:411 (-),score=56.41 TRINITY_DN14749_c1_g2_i1:31-1263(-)